VFKQCLWRMCTLVVRWGMEVNQNWQRRAWHRACMASQLGRRQL